MAKELQFTTAIKINAPLADVWNALIDPESTKQYMFGCIPITDWKEGNSLIWRGGEDGIDYVVGIVKTFEPPVKLVFTVFDPHSKYEDIPENYLTSEYHLTESDAITQIQISQGDYAVVEDGRNRFEHAAAGWDHALGQLKLLLE